MLSLKPGVDVFGIRPELVIAVMVAERIWSGYGIGLTLTSARDGRHSETSLHYAGAAVDFRIHGMSSDALAEAVRALKESLGRDFDVILETDHVHVEYQPRGRV